ncbi:MULTISPECIES: TIGR03085 family metal-binding protein [unclassified Actinotalea]|uniref:TIGR03085 family metal-binding protein n=1 Tax=unclassified Actinotalea TaxID=2638618 RepID=UPI0015F49AEE|nr:MULTISPECIES: TIGR03085 family metal-binding protein [unclassified Actinotalea]
MPWHTVERSALVDALREAGPRQPTLCEGWLTEHLAAHVALRESSLVAAGAVVPPLAERAEAAIRALGDRSSSPANYAALVDRVAGGPPRHHPMRLAGDPVNLLELFVHTEDVRRGTTGRATPPRARTDAHAEALWRQLRLMARLAYGRAGVGVVLSTPQGDARVARTTPRGDVTIRGALDDVVLHAFGRRSAADVELTGDPDAVAAVSGAAARP